jgi:hypothetical protein
MALHTARPVQRQSPPIFGARSRSMPARPCPGALPTLHRQKLSRTPQIVPINDKPPT